MSAASIGETFLVNCDDGTKEGVNIIIKAIKNGGIARFTRGRKQFNCTCYKLYC